MTVDELIKQKLGTSVEFHSNGENSQNQCVDLVNFFWNKNGLTPVISTNAKDFPAKADKYQFVVIKNTPDFVPIVGDVAVWNGRVGDGAGHVAIVRDNKATKKTFNSVDQNWSKKELITLETHSYTNVSYFIRAKEASMAVNTNPEYVQALEKDREKFWKEREELQKKLDDLQKKYEKLIESNSDNSDSETIAKLKEQIKSLKSDQQKEIDNLNIKHEAEVKERIGYKEDQIKQLQDKITELQKKEPINNWFSRNGGRKFWLTVPSVLFSMLTAGYIIFYGKSLTSEQLDALKALLTSVFFFITPFIGVEGITDYKERMATLNK